MSYINKYDGAPYLSNAVGSGYYFYSRSTPFHIEWGLTQSMCLCVFRVTIRYYFGPNTEYTEYTSISWSVWLFNL